MVAREDSRAAHRFIVRIRTAVEGDFAAVDPLTDLVRTVNASGNDVVSLYTRHCLVASGRSAYNRSVARRLHGKPGGFDFSVDAGRQIDLFEGVAANFGESLGELLDVIETSEQVGEVRCVRHARDSTDANSSDHRQKCRDLSRQETTAVRTVHSAGTYVSLRATMSYRR